MVCFVVIRKIILFIPPPHTQCCMVQLFIYNCRNKSKSKCYGSFLSFIHSSRSCHVGSQGNGWSAIQAIRILVERFRGAAKDLHKSGETFDRIRRDLVWTALRSLPWSTKSICANHNGTSAHFSVLLGIHPGSVVSPLFFNVTNFRTSKVMYSELFDQLEEYAWAKS